MLPATAEDPVHNPGQRPGGPVLALLGLDGRLPNSEADIKRRARMPRLHTPVCKLLGIDVPIFQAGMSRYTTAELVAAVSNAGGLGIIGGHRRAAAPLWTGSR